MFKVTFLGHQSWLISTEDTHVIVDPLMHKNFGNGPKGYQFERQHIPKIMWSKFPKLNAVVLTHEHEDHFDIASIALFSRKTPIYLSARSSSSAFKILKEMGFKNVQPIIAGNKFQLGSLCISSLAQGQILTRMDEWDVSPLLIYNTKGPGSFFTSIDLMPSLYCLQSARQFLGRDEKTLISIFHGLAFARLDSVFSKLDTIGKSELLKPNELPLLAAKLNAGQTRRIFIGLELEITRHLDVRASEVVSERIIAVKKRRWQHLSNSHLKVKSTGKVFIKLERHLDRYAQFLYGRNFYRLICDSDSNTLPVNRPTLAFIIKDRNANIVYEYQPTSSRFNRILVPNKKATYAVQFECRAEDLLSVFEGIIEPRIFTGAGCHFSHKTNFTNAELLTEVIWSYLHPLNNQRGALHRYRSAYQRNLNPPKFAVLLLVSKTSAIKF